MKSMLEKDLWDGIKNRLKDYQENPQEDDWDKIFAAIPRASSPRPWAYRLTFSMMVISLASFLLLIIPMKPGENNPSRFGQKPADLSLSLREDNTNKQQLSNDHNNLITHHNDSVFIKDNTDFIKTYRHQQTLKLHNANFHDTTLDARKRLTHHLPTQTLPLKNSSDTAIQLAENIVDSVKNDATIVTLATDTVKTKSATSTGKKSKHTRRPSLYVTLTPSLAYYKISPVTTDDLVIESLASDDIFSGNRVGFSVDIGIQKVVSKNIEVFGGLNYYQHAQSIAYRYRTNSVGTIQSKEQFNYTIDPNIETKSFDYRMRNVGVSMGMFYRVKASQLMHKVGVALQYQNGLRSVRSTENYNNAKSTYVNYQILYRLELAFNSKVNFFVMPSFTYAMHANESMSLPLTIRPYRAGIGVGAVYNF